MDKLDVVIVGGGITGASIARDCALRGLKNILLLEQRQIGQATTSVSTGLANRGLRYIDYDLELTKISAQEVSILQSIAPHLLESRKFLIPFFRDSKFNIELFESVLKAYEAIIGQYGAPKHERLGKEQTLIEEPLLAPDVRGSLRIEELLLRDSELARQSAEQACRLGAGLGIGWKVNGVERKNNRLVVRVGRLFHPSDWFEVETQILCNATGPWAEQFAGQLGCSVKLRPTKGVHIMVDKVGLSHGLILDAPDHRYPLTAIRKGSEGWVYVGPTDEDFPETEFDPATLMSSEKQQQATAEERQYLLTAIQRVIPGIAPDQVRGFTIGVRPTLFQKGVKPERLSRNFQIFDHQEDGLPGFISVAGGKLTIARLMAEKATDLICKKLNHSAECVTAVTPINATASAVRLPKMQYQNNSAFSSSKPPLASLFKRAYASGRIGWYFVKHIFQNPRSVLSFFH
ncbi:MAG: FAD-dependent oxidoreductase [bacterium]|nr:FAD-dependent oxidoreductase [bacterium]